MGGRWNHFGFQLHMVLWVVLMFHLQSDECLSLNLEGVALLEFRSRVEIDPYGAFENWIPEDSDPCNWSGVHCSNGNVEMLNLKGLSLRGMLAPELGKLSHLRSLILYKNNFSGVIPKEIGGLSMLELLDLRGNNLSGTIPEEIGDMVSLKHLLLCNNSFHGVMPSWVGKLNTLSDLQFDRNLSYDVEVEIGCLNRKLGHCIWQSSLQQLKKANSFMIPLKGKLIQFLNVLPLFMFRGDASRGHGEEHGDNLLGSSAEPYVMENAQHIVSSARRRLLEESSNLPASPVSSVPPQQFVTIPSTGSGSFPAVPIPTSGNGKDNQFRVPILPSGPLQDSPFSPVLSVPSSATKSGNNVDSQSTGFRRTWTYVLVLPAAALLLTITASMLVMCRTRGVATIGPWKTGLSGQLQKAFIAGVPQLHRAELEAACEDFSNIIQTYPHCTVFKGTLSSGVEIAVVSTAIASSKDWSKHAEMYLRKKIDTLSRVNHKNFVNLLGYCEENDPFTRMMVFEYAPNGTLYEHLHVKELEHLDWTARMRIIMGMAYCLQYMHHELIPPVVHPNLRSNAVFLTDDYAAKIAEIAVWKEVVAKGKIPGDVDMDYSESPSTHPGSNVYDFGILMLEIISGKHHNSEEGSILNWAAEYLNDKRSVSYMIDPTLKSFKDSELDIICEVIEDCTHPEVKKRPTMREVTAKLREVIAISPDAATPRLSPLWWAELEILSVEAS